MDTPSWREEEANLAFTYFYTQYIHVEVSCCSRCIFIFTSFRFRASYIDLNDSRITANLSINPVSFEDTAKHFYLEASNDHGRLEYAFALELTPDPTEATYDPIQGGSSTLGEMSTVLIKLILQRMVDTSPISISVVKYIWPLYRYPLLPDHHDKESVYPALLFPSLLRK